jgi:hypothetical protein
MKRLSLVLAIICFAAACSRASKPAGVDVLRDDTTKVIYATTNCTVKNPRGTEGVDYCNVKTCKQDEKSNCEAFAAGCLKYGNYYSGTAEAGTCKRVL